jgi:T-complex protein 1 subunit beta
LLDKKVGVNQPKRVENAKILIANTPMDTDKIKVNKKDDLILKYLLFN